MYDLETIKSADVLAIRNTGRVFWGFFVSACNLPRNELIPDSISTDEICSNPEFIVKEVVSDENFESDEYIVSNHESGIHVSIRAAICMWRGEGRTSSSLAEVIGTKAWRLSDCVKNGVTCTKRNVEIKRILYLLMRYIQEVATPEDLVSSSSFEYAMDLLEKGLIPIQVEKKNDIHYTIVVKNMWELYLDTHSKSIDDSLDLIYGDKTEELTEVLSNTIRAYRYSGWSYTSLSRYLPSITDALLKRADIIAIDAIVFILRKYGLNVTTRERDSEIYSSLNSRQFHKKKNHLECKRSPEVWSTQQFYNADDRLVELEVLPEEFVSIIQHRATRAFLAGIRECITKVLRVKNRVFVSRPKIQHRSDVVKVSLSDFERGQFRANDARALMREILLNTDDYTSPENVKILK